jgi:membrane carboxypeptidase/penicillin-binding protein PbpC
MERSATYLASGHEGRNGLDPKTVEYSLWCIGNWKKYFVMYMAGKPNLQKPNTLLGKEGAAKLADNIFRAFYDAEVRAFMEPTKGMYNEREPGAIEYGDCEAMHASRKDEVSSDGLHWKTLNAMFKTPESRKKNNFVWLLNSILYNHKCNQRRINRILLNARGMHRHGAITKEHMERLIAAASAVRKSI